MPSPTPFAWWVLQPDAFALVSSGTDELHPVLLLQYGCELAEHRDPPVVHRCCLVVFQGDDGLAADFGVYGQCCLINPDQATRGPDQGWGWPYVLGRYLRRHLFWIRKLKRPVPPATR